MNTFDLIITSDYYCEVYIDSVFTEVAVKNEALKLSVLDGRHTIKCVCTTAAHISIENELFVTQDTHLNISFEDYIFEHPEDIKTVNHFYCFQENFPRLAKAWEDIDYFNQGCEWNGCDVEIQKHIEVYKNGVYGYVNILGEEALDAYYVITDKDKYGFAHGLGRVVIPCIYDRPKLSMLSCDEQIALEESDPEYYWRLEEENHILLHENSHIGLTHMNGKWGFINLLNGNISPIVYDKVGQLPTCGGFRWRGEYIAVRKGELWGVFDIYRNIEIIECLYSPLEVRYSIVYCEQYDWKNQKYYGADYCIHDIEYTIDGKKGLYDLNGKCIVPAIYDSIETYCNGFARVRKDGKWGFIDESGDEIIACEYDQAGDFNDGIAGVRRGDKWGIVNILNQIIYPFELDFCCWALQGYAIISIGGKCGVIDCSGNTIIPCNYDRIRPDSWDKFDSTESPFAWDIEIDEDTGEKIITGRNRQSWRYEPYTYFLCEKYGLWGAFNLGGELILPYIYNSYMTCENQLIGIKETDNKVFLSSTLVGFCQEEYELLNQDYILIKDGGQWKLYNTNGEVALDLEFESYESFLEDAEVLVIKKDGKCAVVNLNTGQLMSSFEYDTVYPFYEGMATVVKDGLHGFINESGNEIIPCQYSSAWMFIEGTAEVDYSFIDRYGNHIW